MTEQFPRKSRAMRTGFKTQFPDKQPIQQAGLLLVAPSLVTTSRSLARTIYLI